MLNMIFNAILRCDKNGLRPLNAISFARVNISAVYLAIMVMVYGTFGCQRDQKQIVLKSQMPDSSIEYFGATYHFVHIGNRVWMTRNLNAGTFKISTDTSFSENAIEKYCLFDDTTNCEKYGAIYRVDEAVSPFSTTSPVYDSGLIQNAGPQGVCPLGWHVATSSDWRLLIGSYGGIEIAGSNLLQTQDLNSKNILQYIFPWKSSDIKISKLALIYNNPKPKFASLIANNRNSMIPVDQALSMLTSTVAKNGHKILITKWDEPSRFILEDHEWQVYGAVRCIRNN